MKKLIAVLVLLLMISVPALAAEKVKSYKLNWGKAILSIPMDAVALNVGLNTWGEPVIYYLEDSNHVRLRRFILMVETGHESVPTGYNYVGTISLEDTIMYHVFEKQ